MLQPKTAGESICRTGLRGRHVEHFTGKVTFARETRSREWPVIERDLLPDPQCPL